jgi:hypothetical protein
MRFLGRMLFATATAGLLAACQADDRVCTQDIATISMNAVDVNGAPVDGLSISDTVVSSHDGFSVDQFPIHAPGSYVVFGDPFRQHIGNATATVRVTGNNGTLRFAATYVFDASGCHTMKVSGPDTVIAR